MTNDEELIRQGYLVDGRLAGSPYGDFERFELGDTYVETLHKAGLAFIPPGSVNFPFRHYPAPAKPRRAKPDTVYAIRVGKDLVPRAVKEAKGSTRMREGKALLKAAEQALYSAVALSCDVAIVSDGSTWKYVDVQASLRAGDIRWHDEGRDLSAAVLANLVNGDAGVVKDPQPLAESVWQTIWMTTKAEPKECLLTFVEMFILKFLSDNLAKRDLPDALSFYELVKDHREFVDTHGTTEIEYYVEKVRPRIKQLFPDNTVAKDAAIGRIFGVSTVVSKTSVINGFAFLKTSDQSLKSFNDAFKAILKAFDRFGPLTRIDPEFKLRLYEMFLKRSMRQQTLGQFFTPRNIVRPMIRMARLDLLPDGAVLLDPAAGVGGFVLEPMLHTDALPGNIRFEKGAPVRRVRTIGVDVDANTHILAKANMLIHLAELVRDPKTTLPAVNQAMAETFLLMNGNQTLGALEHPPRDTVDVILTNPPYVTRGSSVYKDAIAATTGLRNGVSLRTHYDRCGLGLEALFLRYVSGALRPGGRAFVIVPLGMLNRTERGPKARILEECNVVASIQLPPNAFFNTSQKTCVLVLERRHTTADERPNVFCAVARSIGETLDYLRLPDPSNDLADIAEMFVAREAGEPGAAEGSPIVKVVSADKFSDADRWDVARFWSDEEKVALGLQEDAVARLAFVEDVEKRIEGISRELRAAKRELAALAGGPTRAVRLSDAAVFGLRAGTRLTTMEIRANPGDVPVYSCFREADIEKGRADEAWLLRKGAVVERRPVVTVNANGASVGRVFVRRTPCVLTDDVIILDLKDRRLNHDYVAVKLRDAIAAGGYLYEAKLFSKRTHELEVEVPVGPDGKFDMKQQKRIAAAAGRLDQLRRQLTELGETAAGVRLA